MTPSLLNPLVSQAAAVARESLAANLRTIREAAGDRTVLVAGANQYGSVWTRDFCFASGGLLASGERQPVEDTLEQIAAHQRPDGLYPRLLDSYSPITRFIRAGLGSRIPLRAPLRPNFISDHLVLAYDSNALVVDAACRAARGNRAFGERLLPSMERALAWCRARMLGGFIFQPPFSDWKDTIAARRGAVFFTQLQYWKALGSLAELCDALGKGAAAQARREEAARFDDKVQSAFWDESGGFLRDTLELPLLSTDGNLAAVAWGFVPREKALRILAAIESKKLWTPWGPRAGERYPYGEKGWFARLALVHGYQDDFVWLWISALALRALHAAGQAARRDALLETLCERIARERKISEVYRPEDGREVRTWLYRSEAPFSWSSGMLLEAFAELGALPER